MRFLFAGLELVTDRFELLRDGAPVSIRPKPLRLLLHLLSRAPDAVSREEIQAALWPGEAVTDNSLAQAVRQARQAIGPDGEEILATVRGRGYRILCEVQRVADGTGWTPQRGGTPFVGRGAVLRSAREAILDAMAGRPRGLLLSGEPGIGKTRTAEILCTSESLAGAEVVWGRCREGLGASPLRPWSQAVEQLVARRTLDSLRAAAGRDGGVLASVFESLAPLLPVPEPDLSRTDRYRFLTATSRFVRALAAERPLVIVLDDLHFADAISLVLWENLVREPGRSRLLLIGAFRHVAAPPNPPLEKLVADMTLLDAVGPPARLDGLSRDEVAELLRLLTGETPSDSRVTRVFEGTGGNPLFIRSLASADGSHRTSDGELPETFLSTVEARMFGLSPEARACLDFASVLGREFEVEDLTAAVDGGAIEPCVAALDEAYRAGLVVPSHGSEQWRFVHMLVSEGLYERLPPGQRARWHLAAAETLERRWERRPDAVAGLIARHLERAGRAADPARLLAASTRASAQAERAFSFMEAADHCEVALRALEAMGSADLPQRFDLELRLIELRRLEGPREYRIAAGERALRTARRLGPEAIARVALAMHDIKVWGIDMEAEVVAAIDEALAALDPAPSALRARLLARRAFLLGQTERESALRSAEAALSMARAFGGQAQRDALFVAHYVSAGPDRLEPRERLARELLALERDRPATDSAIVCLVDEATDLLAAGSPEEAASWRREAGQLAGLQRPPGIAWYLRVHDTGLALARGDLEQAEALANEAYEAGRQADQVFATITHGAHQMMLANLRGNSALAADFIEGGMAGHYSGGKSLDLELLYLASHGAHFNVDAGRTERARELVALCGADEGFLRIPRDRSWLVTVAHLAHAVAGLDEPDWARALTDLIEPVEHLHAVISGPVFYAGSMAGARARLLESLGDLEGARRAWSRAVELERRLGALPTARQSEERRERLREPSTRAD